MTSTALRANIDFQKLLHLCLKVIGLESVLASFPKGNLYFIQKRSRVFLQDKGDHGGQNRGQNAISEE